MTVVSCRQLAPRVGEPAANRQASSVAVREAVADGADVVILPELVTTGYPFLEVAEARSAAITLDDPLFGEWVAELGDSGAVLVAGFAELGSDDQVYNSAAVVDASGVLAVYRKTHLWDREKLWFTAGLELPPVVDTRHGRLGVLICYDAEFPELTRYLALQGADLLTVPTNWPLVDRPVGEHPPEVIIAMAAARVNRMPIALCDRTGTERGMAWTAGSTIVDERGWVVASTPLGADEPTVLTADLDLMAGRDKRYTVFAHALEDRRPELYGGLLER